MPPINAFINAARVGERALKARGRDTRLRRWPLSFRAVFPTVVTAAVAAATSVAAEFLFPRRERILAFTPSPYVGYVRGGKRLLGHSG